MNKTVRVISKTVAFVVVVTAIVAAFNFENINAYYHGGVKPNVVSVRGDTTCNKGNHGWYNCHIEIRTEDPGMALTADKIRLLRDGEQYNNP